MRSIQLSSILLVFLLVLLAGCFSVKESQKKETTTSNDNQILFLIFEIKKTRDKKTVHLKNEIHSEGKLKKRETAEFSPLAGDLKISFLNKNKQLVEAIQIENPLHQLFEYFDKKGNGAIKEVWLDENTFQIRVQLKKEMLSVKIEEYISENELQNLYKLTL